LVSSHRTEQENYLLRLKETTYREVVGSPETRKVIYDMSNAFARWMRKRATSRPTQKGVIFDDMFNEQVRLRLTEGAVGLRPPLTIRSRVERAGSLTSGYGPGWVAYYGPDLESNPGDSTGAYFSTWDDAMRFAFGSVKAAYEAAYPKSSRDEPCV
jgi:hypothetical protein